jgi:hypothetical protein
MLKSPITAIVAFACVLTACATVYAPTVTLDRTRLTAISRITLLRTAEPQPYQVVAYTQPGHPAERSLYDALRPSLGRISGEVTHHLQQQLQSSGYEVRVVDAASDISREDLMKLAAGSDAIIHTSVGLFYGPNESRSHFIPWMNAFYTMQTADLKILSRDQVIVGGVVRTVSGARQLDAPVAMPAFVEIDDLYAHIPEVAEYFSSAAHRFSNEIASDLRK